MSRRLKGLIALVGWREHLACVGMWRTLRHCCPRLPRCVESTMIPFDSMCMKTWNQRNQRQKVESTVHVHDVGLGECSRPHPIDVRLKLVGSMSSLKTSPCFMEIALFYGRMFRLDGASVDSIRRL